MEVEFSGLSSPPPPPLWHWYSRHSDTLTNKVACVIGEGEGERGSREKMRGIGERGEGTPATRTPFDLFPPNDFRLIKLPYPPLTVISSTNQNQARVSLRAGERLRKVIKTSFVDSVAQTLRLREGECHFKTYFRRHRGRKALVWFKQNVVAQWGR